MNQFSSIPSFSEAFPNASVTWSCNSTSCRNFTPTEKEIRESFTNEVQEPDQLCDCLVKDPRKEQPQLKKKSECDERELTSFSIFGSLQLNYKKNLSKPLEF